MMKITGEIILDNFYRLTKCEGVEIMKVLKAKRQKNGVLTKMKGLGREKKALELDGTVL